MAIRSQKKWGSPGRARTVSNRPTFSSGLDALGVQWQSWLPQFLLISGITLWIYWPALRGDFVWDDGLYITSNPLLHDLTGLWKFWFQPGSWIEYYPVEETVLWLQWQLWGNDTLGYHVTNLFLHIVNALLVWRLLGKFGLRLAWWGGLIFAVHPVQVESVAWITELKNTLSLPFFLLSMGAWIDYEQHGRARDYRWALGMFVIAMLCKITMAPFPVIILLYAWWKRGRIGWTDVKAALPFLVISLILGGVAIWAGGEFAKNAHAQAPEIPLGGFFACFARAGIVLAYYFSKSLLPVDLSPLNAKWLIYPESLFSYLPWLIFGFVLAWSWKKRREWGRHVLLGLGFFVIFLLPFLGVPAISYMQETWVEIHLLYLPLIGLIGLTVAGFEDLDHKLHGAIRPWTIGVISLGLLLMASGARAYAGWFINDETLWSRTLERDPDSFQANLDLGTILMDQKHYPEAVQHLERAVSLQSDFAEGHDDLGLALDKMGRTEEAGNQYQQALRLNPANPRAYLNLGEIMRRNGDLPAAEALFKSGLQHAPDDPSLSTNLGGLLFQTGRTSEAIALYESAIERNPDFAQLQYDLGVALLQTGSVPDAARHLDKAVMLSPNIAAPHQNLGVALARLGHLPAAIAEFEAALQIDPQLGETRDNLALALVQTGHIAEGTAQFRQALQMNPNDNKARDSLVKLQALPSSDLPGN